MQDQPIYLSKRLRSRMGKAGLSGPLFVDHVDDISKRYDNPAWPDMSERFTPTMAGLPEPEPQWRSPLFWPVLIVFYALVIMLVCLTMPW